MVTTVRGLEEILANELKCLVPSQALSYRRFSGRVFLDVKNSLDETIDLAKKLLKGIYVAERIILILNKLSVEDINAGRSKNLISPFLSKLLTYRNFLAVRAEEANCSISSQEIASKIGEAWDLISLDDPDLVIQAICDNNIVYIGIDLTGFRTLHRRFYRKYIHPSMLNPIIANAMLDLVEVKSGDSILDPMCGSGTILIECKLRFPDTKCRGFDINPQHVHGALLNARAAGVDVEIEAMDICSLKNFLEPRTIDAIITNPPYGIRERAVGKSLENVYECLFKISQTLLKNKGKLCLITPRKQLIKRISKIYSNIFKLAKKITIIEGGLKTYIFLFYREDNHHN